MNNQSKWGNCKTRQNKYKLCFEGSAKVLRNTSSGFKEALKASKNTRTLQGGEIVTAAQLARLVDWLKKEGYTLEEITALLKHIANLKD